MGRLRAFCIPVQTWTSYVGILQRMSKPGSFASIACTLSEHLKARPKDIHLQRALVNVILAKIDPPWTFSGLILVLLFSSPRHHHFIWMVA
jgi:hypothetical protein